MPDWRPTATVETLRIRARLLSRIRAFFVAREVLEVDTPALWPAANPDPQIESLPVLNPLGGQPAGWLHSSPEFAMKRLLAGGVGDCYQLSHVYRAEEQGRLHAPEFTLLEWYRQGFSSAKLMTEVEELVRDCRPGLGPAQRLDYGDLFQRHVGLDAHTTDADAVGRQLQGAGLLPTGMESASLADLQGVAFAQLVEPALPAFAFVSGFPVCQASLARIVPGRPPIADRFELYLDGVELANGFRELLDPAEQRSRFESELAIRRQNGQPAVVLDECFLQSLEAGLPDCAGVALGVDRLLMNIIGADSLRDVLPFNPLDQPEPTSES